MLRRIVWAAARGVALVALLVGGGACSDTLLAEDYTTSCASDAECVAVGVGDMCECACTAGAINVSDLERYQEDRGDISCGNDCGPCPPLPEAVCSAGTCAIAP